MKPRTKQLLFSLVLILLCINTTGQDLLGGSGTSSDPYQVSTPAHLNNVRTNLTAYYIQTANIDLYGYANWEPIAGGGTSDIFTGQYDGGGFTISNLTIDKPNTANVGLFGHIGPGTSENPAIIKNVNLVNVDVAGARGTGSLVGRVTGNIYTLIEGCSASGEAGKRTVTGDAAVGGLVGSNNSETETPGGTNNPIISKSWAEINVTYSGVQASGGLQAEKYGGLAGCNQKGTILDSYARGSVTANKYNTWSVSNVGGLAGCIIYRGRVERSYSTGPVSGTEATNIGGLVGNNTLQGAGNNGVSVNTYWDTQTSGQTISAVGTGLTTDQMKTQSSFIGFHFVDVWNIGGDPEQNDGYPFLRDVPVTTYITWTGGTSDSWRNAVNWSLDRRTIPTDIAVIPANLSNYPVLSTIITFDSVPKGLSIESGASLTIEPGGGLTITSLLANSAGPAGIKINSDANGTGSLKHNSNNVEANIERYIPASGQESTPGYHFVSIPLTQEANPLSSLFLWSYLFEFNVVSQDWLALGGSTTVPLSVDKGYMIYKYTGSKNWSSDTTYSFAGPMNNGVFGVPVTYQTAGSYSGLNLVPNPYPSAIDWEASSGWTKTNINDAIWIWNPGSGNYASYISGSGTNGGSQYIPVGQSFFIQASASAPELVLNNNVRVHNAQQFLKQEKNIADILRLAVSSDNYSDEAVVRFRDDASNAFDGQLDAIKMFGLDEAPQLYSLTNGDIKLSIYSLPLTTEPIEIAIGFELNKNQMVTMNASSIDSFDPDVNIYLQDLHTGSIIDLRSIQQYSFYHHTDNDPMRFKVLFNDATAIPEKETPDFLAYFVSGSLHLNIPDTFGGQTGIRIINTNGQIIYTGEVTKGYSVVEVSNMKPGIYIVEVVTVNYIAVKKVLVK